MTDSKLLPLQFRSCVDPDQSYAVVDSEGDRIMSDYDACLIVPNAEIAELMVKATNSQQSLIDALEGAKRELYNARLVLNRIDKTPTWIKGIDKSIEKTEAALLAARG